MPEYEGLIKYPLAKDLHGTSYGQPQWWRDLAITVNASIEAKAEATQYWRGTIAAGTSHESITRPGRYGVLSGRLTDGPDGAGSGFLQVSELVSGGSTTIEHEYVESGTGVTWKSTRGTSGWTSWTRTDATPRPPAIVSSGSLNGLTVGKYLISAPAAVTNGPPTDVPGLYDRSGEVDTYTEQGDFVVTWTRRKVGGVMTQWAKSNAEVAVPHALTRPLAASTESVTSRSVRIPFRVPVRARRWRIVIRNANYRTNTAYPGAVTIVSLAVGGQARNANGNGTSSFAPVDGFPSGLRLILKNRAVPNMGEEWTSGWGPVELSPGTDYMLSLGYQTDGQEIHLGMGGGWQTNGKPTNAELVNDATAAPTNRQPFDIRIEYATDDTASIDIVFGDSIAAGSNASFPVMEAPLAIADRASGRATRLMSFGGAAFGEWIGGNWGDPASAKWLDVLAGGRTDRALIALGSNDIHAGTDLSTLKANFAALATLLKERVSSSIVACTVTPRTAWVGTPKETLRVAFNDWLRTYPEGIVSVADTARAVEDSTGHAPRADYVTSDGIHFNTAGSTALANAILGAGPQASRAEVPVTDWAAAIAALNAAAN